MLSATKKQIALQGSEAVQLLTLAGRPVYFFIISLTALSS